jgi:hypothetical protein
MAGTLAFLLGFAIAASRAEAGGMANALEDSEVGQCREWIESHSPAPDRRTALTRILSPRTLCFDGDVYSSTVKEAIAWADKAEADREVRPRLVVRSAGGDAGAALDLAEKLQGRDAEVTIVDYCMSSCANYFFAGLRRRYVMPGALILFHGGLSAEDRPGIAEALDQALLDPELARHVGDPGKWRADQLKKYDDNIERQNKLYRRVGVDPLVVTGMGRVDEEAIPASDCGSRKGARRSTLFFDVEQLHRLGIVIEEGRPSTDPSEVDRRLAQFQFSSTACAVPATFFSAQSSEGRLPR